MATVFANISTVGKGLRDFKNLSFDSKIWSEFKEKTANYFYNFSESGLIFINKCFKKLKFF